MTVDTPGPASRTLAGQIAWRLVRDFLPLHDLEREEPMLVARLPLAVGRILAEMASPETMLPVAVREVAETYDDPALVAAVLRECLAAGVAPSP